MSASSDSGITGLFVRNLVNVTRIMLTLTDLRSSRTALDLVITRTCTVNSKVSFAGFLPLKPSVKYEGRTESHEQLFFFA